MSRQVYVVMLEQLFASPTHFFPVAVTEDADLAQQIASRDTSYNVWEDVPFVETIDDLASIKH